MKRFQLLTAPKWAVGPVVKKVMQADWKVALISVPCASSLIQEQAYELDQMCSFSLITGLETTKLQGDLLQEDSLSTRTYLVKRLKKVRAFKITPIHPFYHVVFLWSMRLRSAAVHFSLDEFKNANHSVTVRVWLHNTATKWILSFKERRKHIQVWLSATVT